MESKNKSDYRITTDGETFRIEVKAKWTTGIWRKTHHEEWFPCDNVLQIASDDDGWLMEEEIVHYDSLDKAKAALESWFNPPTPLPEWKQVYP